MNVYKHNEEAYNKVVESFKTEDRVCVVQPTGTGKSYIALQLIKDNLDKKIMYITSLKPNMIEFKEKLEVNDLNNTDCCIYQNLKNALESIEDNTYDYIILDEMHRAGAYVWGESVKKLIEKNKGVKLLGMSATPIRYLDNQRDMVEEMFDGNKVHELKISEAIAQGILKRPRYVTCLYSLEEEYNKACEKVEKIKNKSDKEKALGLLKKAKAQISNAQGLEYVFRDNIDKPDSKCIMFCRDLRHLIEMVNRSKEWFSMVNENVHRYTVYSESKKDSQREIEKFKNDNSSALKVLFCIDMINEGVHIDGVNVVILMRNTISPNVYLQQIGRALSVDNKEHVTIIDVTNNFECMRMSEQLGNEVRTLIESDSVEEDFSFEVYYKIRDFVELMKEIESLSCAKTWDEMFEIYKSLIEQGINVTQCYITEDGINIGNWVRTQRKAYKDNKMIQDRVDKLNSIEFQWAVELKWDEMFEIYKTLVEQGVEIRFSYVTEGGINIGNWVNTQRQAYKNNKMSQDRIDKLNSINFKWCNDNWGKMFEIYKSLIKKGIKVRSNYVTEDGINIGAWVATQKVRYKSNKMPQDRINKLNSINIEWVRAGKRYKRYDWDEVFEIYKSLIKQGINVTQSYITEDGINIGTWVNTQRQKYKNNKMPQDRIDKLNSINFKWNIRGEWDEMFEVYKSLVEQGVNVNRRYITEDGVKIGIWVSAQRKAYKDNKLSQDKIDKLNSMGFKWCANDSWNEMFEIYKSLVEQGVNVTKAYITEDGVNIGYWVSTQRRAYKNNKMMQYRIEKLDSVNPNWRKR